MKAWIASLLALGACLPGMAQAADQTPSSDVFSYSTLEFDHLAAHSDYFDDRSSGNGLRFSYDTQDMVYLFGQWAKLDFDRLSGSHRVAGLGVGAHTAYSQDTSFYIDLEFLQDKLDATLGSAADDYWRISYGFRSHASDLLEYDGAISTERNTRFGGRPFGVRLGLGLDFSSFDLLGSVEHTADGNRVLFSLVWAYR